MLTPGALIERDPRIRYPHRARICEPLARYIETLCVHFVVKGPPLGLTEKALFEKFRPLYFAALGTNKLEDAGFVTMLWACAWSNVLSPQARLEDDGTVFLSAGGRFLDEPIDLVAFMTANSGLASVLACVQTNDPDRSVIAARQIALAMPDLDRGLLVGQLALSGFRNLRRC